MDKTNTNNNFAILALVAIVAVIGVVSLMMSGMSTTKTNVIPSTYVSEGTLAGNGFIGLTRNLGRIEEKMVEPDTDDEGVLMFSNCYFSGGDCPVGCAYGSTTYGGENVNYCISPNSPISVLDDPRHVRYN